MNTKHGSFSERAGRTLSPLWICFERAAGPPVIKLVTMVPEICLRQGVFQARNTCREHQGVAEVNSRMPEGFVGQVRAAQDAP